jgi:cytidylate kinase
MIKVITVEREYGCGAGGIARAIADKLGWQLWDDLITHEIARRMKCDIHQVEQREERLDPTFYRLVKVFMRGSYEDRAGGKMELLDAEHLAHLFERIASDIASKGNAVIVGRGAPWFLRERSDTFRVFIYAPHEEKIRRVMASGRSRAEAEELVDRVDGERAAFVKKYYNKTWPLRELYHLMINSQVGDDLVVRTVLGEIDALNQRSNVSQKAG